MTLLLLSWNVRGLNNPRKREVCKNLLKDWKCNIVCFQEMKVSSTDVAFIRSLWGSPFTDWAVLDAVQTSGGVLLVWDKRVFEKLDVIAGQFSVSVLLRGMVDDFVWACTGVYGPSDDGQRASLWEELSQVCARWPMAWCIVGDFNIIRYPSERLGCESFSPAMFAFSNFIESNSLVDLPFEGASFTWFRDFGLPSMSRIDRALVSLDWEEHFENGSQRVLPCVIFYHYPLLLEAGAVRCGWSAFNFENMWLKVEGFVDRVQQWWNGYSFVGLLGFILSKKLKALKADLKKWNKEVFGDLAFRKKNLLTDLMGLDAREELLGLSNEDQLRRIQLKGDIEQLASLEEISWR